MKKFAFILFVWAPLPLICQEEPPEVMEEQLETMVEDNEEDEMMDDSWWQYLDYLSKNKLNLNAVTEEELTGLKMLSAIQIDQFFLYKRVLGNFISLYELQSIPAWDIPLIRKILPYVTIGYSASVPKESFGKMLKNGNSNITLRYGRVIEKAKGYLIGDTGLSRYSGDPSRWMLRYKYQYKNRIRYGFTATKDAGEQFFRGNHRGFDFYSFHFFVRRPGIIKAIALGDYTVNMGQGLIHWQGLSFGKESDISFVKKQSEILSPYNSSGSFYFHRGAALQLAKANWQGAVFISSRNLDAKLQPAPADEGKFVSSIHTSGYHRTNSEIADRNSLTLHSYGANLRYKRERWQSAINFVHYSFDHPIKKEVRPYNSFSLSGNTFYNFSLDYSYTYKNLHSFGELAFDNNLNSAFVQGMLLNVHAKAGLSVLYRNISQSFQSFFGNAFNVNSTVANEKGVLAGISLKPFYGLDISLFSDLYHFPWLKYRVDAPSYGRDFRWQAAYKLSKQTLIESRFRTRQREQNQNTGENALREVIAYSNRSWRTQFSHRLNAAFAVRHRFELLWYSTENKTTDEKGFLAFTDLFYKPPMLRLQFNGRIQYFDTNSYNSRLYAFESDVLYYYSVPAFYDKGMRYYVNVRYTLNRMINLWLKWGQTIYSDKEVIGSGLDEITGNKKSEFRLLINVAF